MSSCTSGTKYDGVFADLMAQLCLDLYDRLGKNGKPIPGKEWTLLAGVARLGELGSPEVVALGTGTKCLGGTSSMSPNGDLVNDSHAEVIARRSFLRYLYEQMEDASLSGESKDFIRLGQPNGGTRVKFRLRNGVSFHFFTSHVPCGDASIIPMTRAEREALWKTEGGPPLKISRIEEESSLPEDVSEEVGEEIVDVHRTGGKALSGEARAPGVGYHVLGAVRSKPGRGGRTLSVSCSDKLARWIFQGVQGSLLGSLLESPIFFGSITVGGGGQFSVEALERGLVSRWHGSPGQTAPPLPVLLRSTLVFACSRYSSSTSNSLLMRPCPASITWTKTERKEQLEVIVEGRCHGLTKKALVQGKGRSGLTKVELFKRYVKLDPDKQGLTYREAKDFNTSYRESFKDFKKKLGSWTSKPTSLEQFRANFH